MTDKVCEILLGGREAIEKRWKEINSCCCSVAIEPAPFSKSQTIKPIVEKIRLYPSQKPNTSKAMLYNIDFCERDTGRGPYGSLPEIVEHSGYNELFIFTRGGGILWVEMQSDKNFKIVQGFYEDGSEVE